MDDEDVIVDFPRGGAKVLTALETRKIKESAKNDVLFGNVEPEKKKRKKNVKKDGSEADSKENKASINKHSVHHFSFKYLIKGMLVLGYVKEIYKTDIVIGLPNSLNGFLKISELQSLLRQSSHSDDESSDDENDHDDRSVSDLFTIGQLVPVSVKCLYPSKTGYQKVALSVLPEDINVGMTTSCIKSKMVVWGMIQSVEDHGYVVSLGKDKISGFLRKATESFKVGTLRWFCVQKAGTNKKVVNLCVDDEIISKAEVNDSSIHFNSLLPGQLVKMSVTEVSEDGVTGKVCDAFDAVVESSHLMQHGGTTEMSTKKKLIGRIIHVNSKTKQIGITLVPNIVAFSKNVMSAKYKIGDIVEDCEVIKFESMHGLFMKMPNEEYGAVHISRISDEHTEKISKKYKTGTQHRCRVLGYSALDSAYILTVKKSDLEKPFLRYEDLKGGMKISGEVISLEEFGCLVKITNQIRGLCPTMHLCDINLTHPEKKFQDGKKLKFRVLYVKPESRQLILTHKKTLIRSKLPLIVSTDDIKVGEVVHGFVSRIKSFGMFVNFYNEIQALLPKSEINCSKTASLNDLYFVGQVVQCTVITVNKEENKLVVSLKDHDVAQLSKKSLKRGHIVSTSFQAAHDDKCSLKTVSNGIECFLPLQHYSDFKKINEEWKSLTGTLKEGFVLENTIVFGYYNKTQETVVSQKQALIQDGCKVNSFQDLKVGMVCSGVVSHIMSYGVFVELSPQLIGLVPISELADEYIKTPADVFHTGQSLIVKVSEINDEKHRFLISSKPSVIRNDGDENTLNSTFSGCSLLKVYLSQRRRLHENVVNCTDAVINSLPTLIGEIIIAKVAKVCSEGVWLSYHVEDVVVEGFIPLPLRYGADFEVGKECQCYVFNVDLKTKMFFATSSEEAITAVIKRNEKGTEVQYPEEKKLDAIVAAVDDDVVIVLLVDQSFTIGYMPARKHLNAPSEISRRLKIGQKVLVKLNSVDDQHGVIVSSIDEIDDASKVMVGSMLTAVIKGIKPTQLSVTLLNGKMHGRVHVSNIADDFEDGKSLLSNYQPMQLIDVKVIGFKDMATRTFLPITQTTPKALVELSLKPSVLASMETTVTEDVDLKKGDEVHAYVTSVTKRYIWLSISPSIKGKISLLHFSTDHKELKKILSTVKPGFGYLTLVVGYSEEHNCTELSRIGDPSKLIVKGAKVNGRVSRILDNGLLVQLPDHKAGIVNLTEVNDSFEEDPLREFKVNQIMKCHILNVKKGDQIDLSLRGSRLSNIIPEEWDRAINGYDDLKEGDILRGYVKSSSKVGVFVSLSSNITGRVQIKNLSQFFVKNYVELFPVGRLVKAKILGIDPANNHIDLSLRGKDVGGPDLGTPPKRKCSDDNEEEDGENGKKKRKLSDETSDTESECDESDDDIVIPSNDITEDSEDEQVGEKPCLQLSTPFDWNADVDNSTEVAQMNDSDEATDDEETQKNTTKKTKRQKRAAKKAEEEYLHKAELALLDTKSQLESAEDFDRLILGSPDSSLVWIQYMAFHLHSAEVEKARAVAEKALKTISYREEQEKFNVWIALLNLESMYGTPESLDKCFQNALKVNETKKVYSKMADIYIKGGKKEEAEKLFQTMIRKFRTSLKVWTGYGYFLMKNGQVDAARKLLQRSLKSLPQRKHIENIVKFAVMEYKMGEPNRGSTIFESILKNYPKRTDLWSIYIDMSIKDGDLEHVRNTFERAIALVINSKKMKFLFKRYLNFEEQYGNKGTIEGVKKKALEYVENKMVEGDE